MKLRLVIVVLGIFCTKLGRIAESYIKPHDSATTVFDFRIAVNEMGFVKSDYINDNVKQFWKLYTPYFVLPFAFQVIARLNEMYLNGL